MYLYLYLYMYIYKHIIEWWVEKKDLNTCVCVCVCNIYNIYIYILEEGSERGDWFPTRQSAREKKAALLYCCLL